MSGPSAVQVMDPSDDIADEASGSLLECLVCLECSQISSITQLRANAELEQV